MKRTGYLFERIFALDNLLLAARKAFRGKKNRTCVAAFYFDLEREILSLQSELKAGSYELHPYHSFIIYESKERKICAADFRDRVLHHALCNVLDSFFERCMIADTYACRVGKGTHAAVGRAQHFSRRFQYFLKCDVRKYFESIDHGRLKDLLRRMFKDHRLLDLLDQIIDHPVPGGLPGKGLPIGNLTSQYFANIYLGELDHYLKDRLRVKGYLRYMDDFLLFADEKSALHEWLASVRIFLQDRLCLELKEETLMPVSRGIPFLGFRVFPGLIRLNAKKWIRFKRTVKRLEKEYGEGRVDEEELAARLTGMIGHVVHADTLEARRAFFAGSLDITC